MPNQSHLSTNDNPTFVARLLMRPRTMQDLDACLAHGSRPEGDAIHPSDRGAIRQRIGRLSSIACACRIRPALGYWSIMRPEDGFIGRIC